MPSPNPLERLEEFLKADTDYARFDAECNRLQAIVNEQNSLACRVTSDFEAWNLCENTLEFAALDVDDYTPDNLALFNAELAQQQLTAGKELFKRLKRDCLVVAGEASKKWAQASDQLQQVEAQRQARRFALVDIWNEMQKNKKAAEKEAE